LKKDTRAQGGNRVIKLSQQGKEREGQARRIRKVIEGNHPADSGSYRQIGEWEATSGGFGEG